MEVVPPRNAKRNLIDLLYSLQNIFPDLLQTLRDDPQILSKVKTERSPYTMMQKVAELSEDIERLIWMVYKVDANQYEEDD